MATRMQQRRGTATQWTTANPILAAAEIGFESDTGKFKIGDGVNHWADLTYFVDGAAIADLVDGAPELLNTLNELAAAIGDDPDFITTMASKTYVADSIDTHNLDTTGIHGIEDTSALATNTFVSESIDTAIGAHVMDTTNIHGIEDTSALATKAYADAAVLLHQSETTNIHGILDTSVLATQSDIDDVETFATDAISTHNSDTTSVHGIADTSLLATQSDISATETYADDAVSTHNLDTTSVHGIADTSVLTTTTDLDNLETSLQSDIDTKAPIASPTFTGTVSGITKSMVGLGNVDNTADSAKPVSTAQQTALDLKADKASPTFTGTVNAANLTLSGNLTVSGTTTTVNSSSLEITDPMIYMGGGNTGNAVDLGIVSSFNDGTYQHSGMVRDASDGKWKLFKGVTDEPTTTVNFAQGSLDALAVGALEATTVTPSSGVVFSDGTQTKEGVVSRTPIVQKTDSYTLSALTERDSLIEISKASAVTLTIPADSALNFPIGTSLDILQTGAGQITIAGAGGVTVNSTPGLKLRTQWSGATLFKRAANTWVVYGDLSA